MDKDARKDPKYFYNNQKISDNRHINLKAAARPLNKIENHNSTFPPKMSLEELTANQFRRLGTNYYVKNTPFGQVMYEKHRQILGDVYLRIK